MAETTFPKMEKYAKLWLEWWKQVYFFDELDTNLAHPYQVYINTYDENVYVRKEWRYNVNDYNFYYNDKWKYVEVESWATFALQISNNVVKFGWEDDNEGD